MTESDIEYSNSGTEAVTEDRLRKLLDTYPLDMSGFRHEVRHLRDELQGLNDTNQTRQQQIQSAKRREHAVRELLVLFKAAACAFQTCPGELSEVQRLFRRAAPELLNSDDTIANRLYLADDLESFSNAEMFYLENFLRSLNSTGYPGFNYNGVI